MYRLASELVIDGVVNGNDLREELTRRFALYETKEVVFTDRKHPVYPV